MIYLFLGNSHIILYVREDSRFNEITFISMATTTTLQLSTLCLSTFNQFKNSVKLLCVNLQNIELNKYISCSYYQLTGQITLQALLNILVPEVLVQCMCPKGSQVFFSLPSPPFSSQSYHGLLPGQRPWTLHSIPGLG